MNIKDLEKKYNALAHLIESIPVKMELEFIGDLERPDLKSIGHNQLGDGLKAELRAIKNG